MGYVTVNVDVDMDDFDTDELIEELEDRGYNCIQRSMSPLDDDELNEIADKVYLQIRDGSVVATKELRELISQLTGRIL